MPACHAGGHGFEPRHDRQINKPSSSSLRLIGSAHYFTDYSVKDVSAADEVFRTLGINDAGSSRGQEARLITWKSWVRIPLPQDTQF